MHTAPSGAAHMSSDLERARALAIAAKRRPLEALAAFS